MEIIPASFGKVDFKDSWSDGKIVFVAETIVTIQKRMSIEKWLPFSFSDYMDKCDHIATYEEKKIMNGLADTGYLKIDSDNKYNVTPLFLQVIERFVNKAAESKEDKRKKK